MTNEILYYNINDILNVQLIRDKKFDLMGGLDLELSYFRVKDISNPDIILNIGNFTPSNKNCFIVDNKYYIKDNYFYCNDYLGKTKWKIEINGFENDKTIINYSYFTWNPKAIISRFSMDTFLLRPIIYYKLSEKGYYMIHAAGISKNDEAYIFPARGGAFKTSLTMDFINKSKFNYLGDDWIILHKDKILSFPAHITLFNYIRNHNKDENISFIDKVIFIKSLWKDKYDNINTPIIKSAKLKGMYFIEKTNKNDVDIKKLELRDSVNKIVESTKAEMSSVSDTIAGFSLGPYYRYMQAYSFVFPESKIAKYFDNLKQHLEIILKDVLIYKIEIPEKYNNRIFQEVLNTIERSL